MDIVIGASDHLGENRSDCVKIMVVLFRLKFKGALREVWVRWFAWMATWAQSSCHESEPPDSCRKSEAFAVHGCVHYFADVPVC